VFAKNTFVAKQCLVFWRVSRHLKQLQRHLNKQVAESIGYLIENNSSRRFGRVGDEFVEFRRFWRIQENICNSLKTSYVNFP